MQFINKQEYNQNGVKERRLITRAKEAKGRVKNWLTEVDTILGEDPFGKAHGDSLYLFQSDPPNRKVTVRKFDNPEGMVKAKPVTVFTPSEGSEYRHEVWAPEVHLLNGKLHLLYAASKGDNRTHRTMVARSQTGDIMGPYEEIGRIYDPINDHWGIDMTVLPHGGQDYAVWSGAANAEGRFPQNIYIAPMAGPTELADERRMISTPTHSWEQSVKPINEGPQVLTNPNTGQLFIVYSADASWSTAYNVGLLEYNGGDITDMSGWDKIPEPVFDENGAGHVSFIETEQGEQVIFFHEKEALQDGWKDRTVKSKVFHFDEVTGRPVFQATRADSEPKRKTPELVRAPSLLVPFGSHRETIFAKVVRGNGEVA